jgi:hypothetical protein
MLPSTALGASQSRKASVGAKCVWLGFSGQLLSLSLNPGFDLRNWLRQKIERPPHKAHSGALKVCVSGNGGEVLSGLAQLFGVRGVHGARAPPSMLGTGGGSAASGTHPVMLLAKVRMPAAQYP